MSRLLYAKPNEHFICLCTYSIKSFYFCISLVYSVNNHYVVLYKCTKIKIYIYIYKEKTASTWNFIFWA